MQPTVTSFATNSHVSIPFHCPIEKRQKENSDLYLRSHTHWFDLARTKDPTTARVKRLRVPRNAYKFCVFVCRTHPEDNLTTNKRQLVRKSGDLLSD